MTTLEMPAVPPGMPNNIAQWWPLFVAAGERHSIPAVLLAAICSRESLGGDLLHPKGPAGTGDWRYEVDVISGKRMRLGELGYGLGLMQIDRRYHATFFSQRMPDGTPNWQVPSENIEYATSYLRKLLDEFEQDVDCMLCGYNAGPTNVRAALTQLTRELSSSQGQDVQQLKRARLDSMTTDRNYVSDVLRRRDDFLTLPPGSVKPDKVS